MNFEEAYRRLEEILDKMNGGSISLDDSLIYYEEADRLINACQKRLNEAEKRIELMVKNRQGEPLIDGEGAPQLERFNP